MIEVISRSNKKLKPLEFSYKDGVKDSDALKYADDVGKMPFIVLNGVNIESKDVKFFKLYNDRYLPEIEMTFIDPTNKLFDSEYPLDQQILSILIKSNESLLMPIRMDFYINEFISIKNKDGESDLKKYEIKASLNVPYIIKHKSYKGTSLNVLKELANEADLGFSTNINSTDDEMTWINCGIDSIREQVLEIIKRSYISDNTFVWAYIDFWYNLNYIDVEQQLNLSTENDEGLIGNERLTGESQKIPLKLSNHPDYNTTNQYISKFNLVNNSTIVNYNLGYDPIINYYSVKEKKINNLLLDTLSTKGSKGDKIVLKGQPDDNNYNLNQKKTYFLGKIDVDNIHKNYLYSEKLNENNLEFLQKIRMNVILDKLNFQLYRFQIINIELYKLKELDPNPGIVTSNDIQESKNTDKYKLNERLSGDWIITGINYIFNRRNGIDNFIQEITVAKRELSAAKISQNE